MTEKDSPAAGTFCWADLATTELTGAKDFYTSLFGWDAEDMEIPGGIYSMFTLRGRYVSAVAEQQEEERAQDAPPHWNVYVSTDDVDAGWKPRAEP